MSKDNRRGLFETLFLRVMIVITVALSLMIMFSHLYQIRYMNAAWRADLQQEAVWTARHFGMGVPPADDTTAPTTAHGLGEAWRSMHENVRLVVRNAKGEIVMDSHPEQAGSGGSLVGEAPIAAPGGEWSLTLSRATPAPFPLSATWEMALAALAIIALTAFLLYPLTRRLTRAFEEIGAEAGRVAAGEFGEPLETRGVRELDRLVDAFNTMSRKLASEQARRQRLVADVSHELRSPLGRVRAIGETIARHPDEAGLLVAQSEAELALLERLIRDLLDTARLEEGRDELVREELALADWWRASMERFRIAAERDGVPLSVVSSDADARVKADGQRLLQAVANIVDNAVTACAGRPEPQVTATLAVEPQAWRIEIADNGRGIPADSLPHVFDRFYRVEEDRGRKTGGVGLGLSIAKAIVEAHGGTIAIDSVAGQGTIVRLHFPRA